MTDRRPISKFRQMTVSPQWPTDREVAALDLKPNTLVFRCLESGEIVAQVDAEDLFDRDGNRFWLDA
jgi:hypothetical protein